MSARSLCECPGGCMSVWEVALMPGRLCEHLGGCVSAKEVV